MLAVQDLFTFCCGFSFIAKLYNAVLALLCYYFHQFLKSVMHGHKYHISLDKHTLPANRAPDNGVLRIIQRFFFFFFISQ